MKIVFIGSVQFSALALQKLFDLKADIALVVTKEASSANSDFVDLSFIAKSNQVNWCYTSDVNDSETINKIKTYQADIIFCFGWSNLIKTELLNLCPLGVIGFHPAELPNNRGRHPLIWAKVLGLKKTASTFFFMDEGADTGDIISQSHFDINFEDRAFDIYRKMTKVALLQIEEFHSQLVLGNYIKTKQDIHAGNYWRKRTKKDGEIDFRMSSENICNLVRALSEPYVGAHLVFENQDIKIWDVELSSEKSENSEPGKILDIKEKSILVKTGNGSIWITKHEFEKLPDINKYLK